MDSSLDVICTLDAAGRFYEVSAACETVWGYTRQELIGMNSTELVHPDDKAKTTRFVDEIVAGGMTRDFRNQWVRKDGTIVDLMWSAKWSSEDKLMYCVARDVTERKRALEALRESEKRFRELADFMPNVVWTSDASGRVDYYNRRWHELTGVSQEAADANSWKTPLHRDDVTRAVAAWTLAIATGRPYQIEYRFLDHESGVYRWHLGRALPIRNNEGEIVRWYASGTDIHELKAAQEELVRAQQTLEERVQERTRQLADANRELEAFSYSVSHDLRTPLKAITGFSNILTENHAADLSLEATRYLENIDKGARQMEQLVDGLLAFSKLGWDALRPREVDMRRLVDAALSMLDGVRDSREVENNSGSALMSSGRNVAAAGMGKSALKCAEIHARAQPGGNHDWLDAREEYRRFLCAGQRRRFRLQLRRQPFRRLPATAPSGRLRGHRSRPSARAKNHPPARRPHLGGGSGRRRCHVLLYFR